MSKYLKYTLLTLAVIIHIYLIIGLIGLYGMEIEDHYGGLQTVYYKSKDDDIIINETTKEFGVVKKSWRRIYLWTPMNENDGLYGFAYKAGNNFRLKVYRLDKEQLQKIRQMNYKEVLYFIDKENSELILEFENN